ncbi:MAG: hypothetical protein NTU57_05090 [Candidatus Aenigmarchaeota archaeon]|nr:hypothetical protein [Candidatus Aenigmarchaeota archaeon]
MINALERAPGSFMRSLMKDVCKMCGKDSARAVQLYPSQVWEHYCEECYVTMKKAQAQ